MQFPTLVLLIVVAWLAGLSFWFAKIYRHYSRLAKDAGEGNLKTTLDKILDAQKSDRGQIGQIADLIKKIIREDRSHIQKVGLIRFNPFYETGGDSSFSLALLDGKLNGVVITGLHARERTRVYIKSIEGGQGKYELSKEEERAIAQAVKSKNE